MDTCDSEPAFKDVWGFFSNKRPTAPAPIIEKIQVPQKEPEVAKQFLKGNYASRAETENFDNLVPLMDNIFSGSSLLDSEHTLRSFRGFDVRK